MTAKKMQKAQSTTKQKSKLPMTRLRDGDELPVRAILEIADWTLDLARGAAYDDAEDIDKVERVRAFLHGSVAGVKTAAPSESDILTVAALAIVAMEQRHGITGLGEVVAGAVEQALDGAAPMPAYPPAPFGPPRRRAPRITHHLYLVP